MARLLFDVGAGATYSSIADDVLLGFRCIGRVLLWLVDAELGVASIALAVIVGVLLAAICGSGAVV